MIAARENALWRRARIDGLVREDIFITSLPGSRAQNAQLWLDSLIGVSPCIFPFKWPFILGNRSGLNQYWNGTAHLISRILGFMWILPGCIANLLDLLTCDNICYADWIITITVLSFTPCLLCNLVYPWNKINQEKKHHCTHGRYRHLHKL